ncbi:DUF6756 family protein [Gottfriedia solisilvae]|uniref:Uncharacterized protein n=1 Tax=Gottfriedia solisilvae TaxID=1516104 RepID=A0A8J3ADG3_9BACI|nr:DUF6756 family protein [Gottfriedia solisilvae]GGI11637.1 hypothetical protein GCM10007380_08840 [Gottfriedia solisilvae]
MKYVVRTEINSILNENMIPKELLSEVGIHHWENIIQNFEQTFIKKPHYTSQISWYWQFLKNDGYSLHFINDDAYKYLHKLIDENEKIFFMVEENSAKPKFWIYEGNIKMIQKVIEESFAFEYYIFSKKFDWLICENHHGILSGVGEKVIGKMKLCLLN